METKDLYILQDGTHAGHADVERGNDGILHHKTGPAVVLDENGEPLTVAHAAEHGGNAAAARAAKQHPGSAAAEKTPIPEERHAVVQHETVGQPEPPLSEHVG